MNTQTRVEVATVWASPDAPREIDSPAVMEEPDLAAWMSALTPALRLGLHGRTLTQLMRGEPVVVLEEQGDWVRIAAPWQPSPDDPRGYPGWVRRSHLIRSSDDVAGNTEPVGQPGDRLEGTAAERGAARDYARQFLGVGYLWGGLSRWGFDCSGLVHYSYRKAGFVIPRDASAQHAAFKPVPSGDEEAGDLYFFASDNGRVTHVGFVAGDGRMLHAPEGGGLIEEARMRPERRANLIGTGRLVAT
ncbi:MAG: C40 family peptidase [Nocardioidaceae bacterium]|nr:C40 family peptidase [Nocardioidaceae bacterium]